jgi:MATE family, multidrug efflux pump
LPSSITIPTRGQEIRTILAISMPLMAAYIAEMGMMITDMIIVGRLGSNELAAVGLTADWFYVLLLIGMGVVSIIGVLVAHSFGEGDFQAVKDAAEQGMIVATICAIPVMLAVWYIGPALQFANQDPDVIRLISDYSRPLAFSVLPALWFVVLRNYVSALEKASGIMTITALALVVNLAINYTLVFGKFGLPPLGVVGAAYGTSIVNWLMFLTLAFHVHYSEHFKAFRFSIVPKTFRKNICKEIFRLGLPVTGAQILGGAMFTVAAIMVGMLGADVLAAQMVVYSVIYVGMSASLALGDAIRVRVAYGIGMRSAAASRQSASIAISLSAAVVLAASLFLWFFPELLVGFFLDIDDPANANVLEIAVGFSFSAGLFLLVDGTLMVVANGLRGLRDTLSTFWIAMIGYWVIGLGVGGWLTFPMGFGAAGLWWGLVAGAIISIVLMFARFRKQLALAESRLAVTTA